MPPGGEVQVSEFLKAIDRDARIVAKGLQRAVEELGFFPFPDDVQHALRVARAKGWLPRVEGGNNGV